MLKTVKLGIAGLGTVGVGVVEIIEKRKEEFRQRFGVNLEITCVVVRDSHKVRTVPLPAGCLTTDANALKNVDVVVELIGGDGVAKDIVWDAMKRKQHVVTANKALLADYWEEIVTLAKDNEVLLKFEAAVAGGVPIIKTIQEGLAANHIRSLKGIINGTANYILTEMEERRESLDVILKEAQAKGYAEADPSFDIDGIDAAHKLSILVALAYGLRVPLEDMHVEGIRHVTLDDIVYAEQLGYRIKLLAIAKDHGRQVEVRVHPTLVHEDHVLAAVSGVYNAIDVEGDASDDILLYGRGAGRYPTASAVVADILDVARCGKLTYDNTQMLAQRKTLQPFVDMETRYYLRMMVCDEPGVLADITSIFGRHKIGIASVIQKETRKGAMVPLVIMTHTAKEKNMQAAIKEMAHVKNVYGAPTCLRVEAEDGE